MLKSIMVRHAIYGLSATIWMLMLVPLVSAQSLSPATPHDFMIDNAPLSAEELTKAFIGRTHNGFYRFERNELSTTRFVETTSKDGRVTHTQGEETLTGTWEIKSDRICFQYDAVWPREYCFDIYRVGTCYYHFIRTSGGNPVNRWTARSTPKGEVPDCEIPVV